MYKHRPRKLPQKHMIKILYILRKITSFHSKTFFLKCWSCFLSYWTKDTKSYWRIQRWKLEYHLK